jgi:hypothetical protein
MAATLCNQISSCNSNTRISFNCIHNLIFYKLSHLLSIYFQTSKTKSFYDAIICTTTLFQTCSNLPFNSEQENLQVALQTFVHHFLWACTNNCNSLKKGQLSLKFKASSNGEQKSWYLCIRCKTRA